MDNSTVVLTRLLHIERVIVAMIRCFLETFISRKMVWIGGLTYLDFN